MKMLNRSALRLRARPAFVHWCEQFVADQDELETLKEELLHTGTVYLVPEIETEQDFQDIVSSHAQSVLKNELQAWCLDEQNWPETLDRTQLEQWFEVTMELMCFDLVDEPLLVADAEGLNADVVEF